MWGVGRLQVHGLRNHRFVYKKVVEDSWSYKRSYLWCFRNPACGDSTGSNRTEKERVRMPPGPFFGVSNHPCFSINDLQFTPLTHLNNEPVFTIYFFREVPFSTLYKYCLYLYMYNILCFFISSYGQGPALKLLIFSISENFKVFGAQNCWMVS